MNNMIKSLADYSFADLTQLEMLYVNNMNII